MGCRAGDAACEPDEHPAHPVFVDAFEIDRIEVTGLAYLTCIEEGPCTPLHGPGPLDERHAVVFVDWDQARVYCEWRGKRLPTEAEWEKAARGTDGRRYPWGNEPPDCERVRLEGCERDWGMETVGDRPRAASPYCMLDAVGGVGEWVADAYAADFYGRSPLDNPVNDDVLATDHVQRGGVDYFDADSMRVSIRFHRDTSAYDSLTGFRCARSMSDSP